MVPQSKKKDIIDIDIEESDEDLDIDQEIYNNTISSFYNKKKRKLPPKITQERKKKKKNVENEIKEVSYHYKEKVEILKTNTLFGKTGVEIIEKYFRDNTEHEITVKNEIYGYLHEIEKNYLVNPSIEKLDIIKQILKAHDATVPNSIQLLKISLLRCVQRSLTLELKKGFSLIKDIKNTIETLDKTIINNSGVSFMVESNQTVNLNYVEFIIDCGFEMLCRQISLELPKQPAIDVIKNTINNLKYKCIDSKVYWEPISLIYFNEILNNHKKHEDISGYFEKIPYSEKRVVLMRIENVDNVRNKLKIILHRSIALNKDDDFMKLVISVVQTDTVAEKKYIIPHTHKTAKMDNANLHGKDREECYKVINIKKGKDKLKYKTILPPGDLNVLNEFIGVRNTTEQSSETVITEEPDTWSLKNRIKTYEHFYK